jgi:hypothetical protein
VMLLRRWPPSTGMRWPLMAALYPRGRRLAPALMTDLELPCCDCGRRFILPVREQQRFADRGWPPHSLSPVSRGEAAAAWRTPRCVGPRTVGPPRVMRLTRRGCGPALRHQGARRAMGGV